MEGKAEKGCIFTSFLVDKSVINICNTSIHLI